MLGIKTDGFVVILDGSLVLTKAAIGCAPTGVSQGILGVEADGFVVGVDGALQLAQQQVGLALGGRGDCGGHLYFLYRPFQQLTVNA